MPESIYNDPTLAERRTASETATGNYNASVAEGATLPDILKESLMKKFSTNNPLIQTRENQFSNYLNTTTQAPLDYTARSAGGNSDIIYNPLQQANLIQSRRSSALAPLATTNDLLDLQTGGIQNLIDASTRAYAGETARLKGGAELSRQSYQDYLNELSMKADEAYKNASLAQKGTSDTTKRTQDATDEAVGALQEHLAGAKGAGKTDMKQETWNFIHDNEQTLAALGVDMATLWKVYNQTEAPVKKTEKKQEGFNLINWFQGK